MRRSEPLKWTIGSGIFSLCVLSSGAPDVRAESDAVCRKYAQAAVDAFKQSQALKCPFAGKRWQGSYDNHYGWCRSAPAAQVMNEEAARTNQLRVCRKEPAAVECNVYAWNAAGQQASNISGRCGFSGARWGDNQDAHLNWCLWRSAKDGNYKAANHEFNVRQAMLGVCARTQPNLRCDEYARRAEADIREASARGCRMGGPPGRWGGTYEDHLTWCIGQSAEAANSETRERGGPLSQCRTTNPLPGGGGAPQPACTISVIVKNQACVNTTGSPSSIESGSLSATGCGDSEKLALDRALTNFAGNVGCLSEGSTPTPGCCTYTKQTAPGCLCR